MPPPPINAGTVSVDGISLNGHAGNTLIVAPGADVQITGTATDTNVGCPSCIMFADVAFRGAGAAAGCFGNSMRLDIPGHATATGTVDLGNAPTALGFYDIVVEGQAQFNCGDGWTANGGTTIAQIWVQPADFNVGAPPIDAGTVSVNGISLNGHAGNTLMVAPGADVQITGTATDTNVGCPTCIMFADVAFRGAGAAAGCFGGAMQGSATATGTVDLGNAPTTVGFYDIVVEGQAQFTCGAGWTANGGTTIAQIRVVAPPVCQAVTSSTAYATPVTITFACTGTTLAYTVSAGGGPAHGTLGAIGGNQVSYTPAAGFSGTDTFHLTATDAAGSMAAETVAVDVGPAPATPTFTLTVSKTGAGSGKVTSVPAGIGCGTTCSHAYPQGTQVTLAATAVAGSRFAGWSGACVGTGTCSVTTNSDQAVTANFVPARCVVPKVKGKTLAAAKRAIKSHNCSVGTIKHAASRTVKKGHVVSQKPRPGSRLRHGAKVNLVVSKGP